LSVEGIPFEYGFDVVPFISGDVGAALAGGGGEATVKRKLSEELLKVVRGVLSQTTTLLDEGIGTWGDVPSAILRSECREYGQFSEAMKKLIRGKEKRRLKIDRFGRTKGRKTRERK